MPAMPGRQSPTVRRRRLSRELRRLREESGMTADEVWRRLEWSSGKLSRIEQNDWRRPDPRDVKDLLEVYGVTDEAKRDALIGLARESRVRDWWQDNYGDVLGSAIVGFEQEAAKIYNYQPLIIPGLLQTAEYARALIRGSLVRDPAEVQRRVDFRMARQEILTLTDPPDLWVILDEAALHRRFGTPQQRREQLQRLIDTGDHDHTVVQVIPYDAGMHPGLASGFVIMDYVEDPSIAYVEVNGRNLYMEQPEDLEAHSLRFQHLQGYALDQDATVRYLTVLRDQIS